MKDKYSDPGRMRMEWKKPQGEEDLFLSFYKIGIGRSSNQNR